VRTGYSAAAAAAIATATDLSGKIVSRQDRVEE
jgi:hypothetical protein